MTLKLRNLRSLTRLLIILLSLTMSLFSEKIFIFNRCISGLMSNLIKKSWMVSNTQHAMPARHMVWSFGLEQLKRRRFFPCLNTGSYISGFSSKIQSQNDCETSNAKKGQLDFYELDVLRHTWNYLKVKVCCCGPAKCFFKVSYSFNLNYSSSCDL